MFMAKGSKLLLLIACFSVLCSCRKSENTTTGLTSSPKYSGRLTLKGLQKKVDVLFDNYGIPHIYAQNGEDTYFALGYIQAQERISQMEFLRRAVTGQLAEVLGDKFVAGDIAKRTVGIAENAKQSAKAFRESPDTPFKRATNSFLAGINFYLANLTPATRPKDLRPAPKAYTLEDIFGLTSGFLYGFAAYEVFSDIVTDQLVNKLDAKYLTDLSILTGSSVNTFFPAKSSTNVSASGNIKKKSVR